MKKEKTALEGIVLPVMLLQVFADDYHGTHGTVDPVTGSTTPYPTGTADQNFENQGLTSELKIFYSKDLIRKAAPKLIHEQFGVPKDIPAHSGDRAEFRFIKSLPKAMTPLVEGVTPKPGKVHEYPKYCDVYQFGDWLGYTDKLNLVTLNNVITDIYNPELAKQAALTQDTVVREIINAGTNVQFAAKNNGTENAVAITDRGSIDKTCIITVQDVYKMAAILRANNAPTKDGFFVAIVHPYVLYDLMMSAPDKMWKDVMSYAKPENMLKGEAGEIGGVRFASTSEAKIFKGKPFGVSAYESLTVKTAAAEGDQIIEINEALIPDELLYRWVRIGGKLYTIAENTANSITLTKSLEDAVEAGATISQGEGGADNTAVFSTLFVAGNDAYGVVGFGGVGTQFIAHPLGHGDDPLEQRGTVGWKAYKGAIILHDEYLIRYESGSTMSHMVDAN